MAGLNDLALRILIGAEDKTGPAVKSSRQGVKSISNELQKLEKIGTRFLNFRLFSGVIQEGIKLSDTYKTLTARLKLVSDSTTEYETAEKQLFGIAQRTRSSLSATNQIYEKVAVAIKKLGGTQNQSLKITETLNKAIALTSQGLQQDEAAILQFSQALASGTLRGDEFRSVMENSPGLARALADGLGIATTELRAMSQAGQLTTDVLVQALANSADTVAKRFKELPVTVSGAFTTLQNSLLKFVGQSDAADSATSKLAASIQFLAGNIEPLADAGILLAKIYFVRVVAGLLKSAQSYVVNAQAAKQSALAVQQELLAAQQNLRLKAQVLGVQSKTALALVQEARLQLALATTEIQRTKSLKSLSIAMAQYENFSGKAIIANKALAESNRAVTLSASKTDKAISGLSKIFNFYLAFEVGTVIGDWLIQFSFFEVAGVRLAQVFTLAAEVLKSIINLDFSGLSGRLSKINQEFSILAEEAAGKSESSAKRIEGSENKKAAAVEKSALKQKISFEKVQAAVKSLTATLDTETKAQSELLKKQLADQLLLIDLKDFGEAEKQRLKLEEKIKFSDLEIQLQQETSVKKLALIDQQFDAEIKKSSVNVKRIKALESEKRQAKFSVYKGLAKFYQSQVDDLDSVFKSELRAAKSANDSILDLERSLEKELFEISLLGRTEAQKLREQEVRKKELIAKAKAEIDKGEQKDVKLINSLLAEAEGLHKKITAASGKGASAQFKAAKAIKEIRGLEILALKKSAKAHIDNAEKIKNASSEVFTKLVRVNSTIKAISDQLQKEQELKIKVDQNSLNATRSIIDELTKTETKIINVVTRTAPQEAQNGGLIQRFAKGGFSKKQGKLPGFGGGDKIRALLEAGEFIIKKETVQDLGLPFLENLNKGLTVADLPKFALGGGVGVDDFKNSRSEKTPELIALLTERVNQQSKLQNLFNVQFKKTRFLESSLGGIFPASKNSVYKKAVAKRTQTRGEIKFIGDEISEIISQLNDLGNQVVVGTSSDRNNLNNSIFSEIFANGSKIADTKGLRSKPKLNPGFFNDISENAAAPLQRFNQSQSEKSASSSSSLSNRGITINLTMNGKTGAGVFQEDSQTNAFIEEVRRSGLVSS